MGRPISSAASPIPSFGVTTAPIAPCSSFSIAKAMSCEFVIASPCRAEPTCRPIPNAWKASARTPARCLSFLLQQRALGLRHCACGRSLGLVTAEVRDEAFGAQRLACHAHITPVQNQPMMRVQFVFFGYHALQRVFDLARIPAGRKIGAIANTKDVRIHSKRRLAERHVQHDIGSFASYTWQLLQRVAIARDLAAMLFNQSAR